MKGVSVILSHMSYIAIGIAALSLIVASVYMWGGRIEEIYLQKELEAVKSSIVSDVIELNRISGTNTIAELGAGLPDKISGESYSVEFNSNTLTIRSKTNKGDSVEVNASFDFDVADSSAVSPFTIKLKDGKIYLVD